MIYLIAIIVVLLWIGYVSNSNKEKALKQQIIDRDKRNQWQYNDLKSKEKYKSLWVAAVATFIVSAIFLIFGCSSKCDTPGESLEQRFTVGKCVDSIRDSVTIDTVFNTFNTICECEEHCQRVQEAVQNSISKDSSMKEYLLKYGPQCNCK